MVVRPSMPLQPNRPAGQTLRFHAVDVDERLWTPTITYDHSHLNRTTNTPKQQSQVHKKESTKNDYTTNKKSSTANPIPKTQNTIATGGCGRRRRGVDADDGRRFGRLSRSDSDGPSGRLPRPRPRLLRLAR